MMDGEELRAAAKRLGVSLAKIGEAVRPPVARSHMSEMASGKRKIGPIMAERLKATIKRIERKR